MARNNALDITSLVEHLRRFPHNLADASIDTLSQRLIDRIGALTSITSWTPGEHIRANLEGRSTAFRRCTAVVVWLLEHKTFDEHRVLEDRLWWAVTSVPERLVRDDKFDAKHWTTINADRAEELVRCVLAATGLVPRGEKPAQAAEKLRTLALQTVDGRTLDERERALTIRLMLSEDLALRAADKFSRE